MSQRISKPTPNASWRYQLWKEKPPGPEQIELERMFASKEIDATATADSIHKSNELFKKFSSTVFGAHFRKTKAKFGLGEIKNKNFIFNLNIFKFFYNYSCIRPFIGWFGRNFRIGWIKFCHSKHNSIACS